MGGGTIDHAALLKFLGFGNPGAEAVFIGMEEGLTLPPSLEEQLAIRSTFPRLMDLQESAAAHPDKYLGCDRPPIQRTWNTIIRVLLALERNEQPTNDEIRGYQGRRLGRTKERGALLELMPLPSKNIGTWPYAEIFTEFPDRDIYLSRMLPLRLIQLREHLSYGPKIVIAYGKSYWNHYSALFDDIPRWDTRGRFQIGVSCGTKVILTPHFTAREMNGAVPALLDLVRA